MVGPPSAGVPPVVGGLAQTSKDSPPNGLKMATTLFANVESVSKVLTTIGILKSLTRHNLTLDDKISTYLYSDWKQGAGIDSITFKDLLTHRSGFRDSCGNTAYSDLKAQILKGVILTDKQNAVYCNGNFGIFRELLPAMEGQKITGADTDRATASANFYIAYMNQNVFQQLGIPHRDCTPPSLEQPPGLRSQEILSYPIPAGTTTNGDDHGDYKLQCGAGGWWLTADDLMKVVTDLALGTVLLTTAENALITAPFPNCIGWDCTVNSGCPNPYLCKNGGDTNFRSYAGIFKCIVPVVVIVNSLLPSTYESSGGIIRLVEEAYNAATRPGTISVVGSGPDYACSTLLNGGGTPPPGGGSPSPLPFPLPKRPGEPSPTRFQ
jgi:hypothetical protein